MSEMKSDGYLARAKFEKEYPLASGAKGRAKPCDHPMIVLGAHPSFQRGFLCLCCKEFVGDPDTKPYVGVIMLLRAAPEKERGKP